MATMSEGQAKRNIGRGMKPRGNTVSAEETVVEETTANEGQASKNDVLIPGDLENGQNGELPEQSDSTVDHPSGPNPPEEGFVAQIEPGVLPSEVPGEANTLADLMKKSAEHNEAEISAGMANLLGEAPKPRAIDIALDPFGTGIYIPTKAEVEALVKTGQVSVVEPEPTIAELDEAIRRGNKIDIQTNGHAVINTALGDQPDGTFKIVVTIPEGMIEGIKQQAETDHISAEEWVTTRLGEYLEQWWFGR